MNDPIPHFVDQMLTEWDFIAFYAYNNFESQGRGAVGLMEGEQEVQLMYGPRDYFSKKGMTIHGSNSHSLFDYYRMVLLLIAIVLAMMEA